LTNGCAEDAASAFATCGHAVALALGRVDAVEKVVCNTNPARLGPFKMSAIWPLSGANRKIFTHFETYRILTEADQRPALIRFEY
jgi:hypothetical protein